jgi:hypothetical protein
MGFAVGGFCRGPLMYQIKVLASARVVCSKMRVQMRGRSTGNCVLVKKKSIFYLNQSYFNLVPQLVVQW